MVTRNSAGRAHAGQRFDDLRPRMSAEPGGDEFVGVPDLTIDVEQFGRDAFDEPAGIGFAGQREALGRATATAVVAVLPIAGFYAVFR